MYTSRRYRSIATLVPNRSSIREAERFERCVERVVSNSTVLPPPARIDRNVLRIGKERKVHNGARSYTRVCSRIWPRKVERDVVSTPGCANIDRGVAVTKNSTEREYGERWRGTGRRFREFRQILHFPSPSLPPSSSSSSSRSISFEDRSRMRIDEDEQEGREGTEILYSSSRLEIERKSISKSGRYTLVRI